MLEGTTMRKISKLGAYAMAFALSTALLSPVTVNAAIYENNIDTTYSYEGKEAYEVYTNRDTKQSISSKDYTILNSDVIKSVRKTQYISTDCYYSIQFTTTADANKITNFKSNKKALKVKVTETNETTYNEPTSTYDYKSNNGTIYYYRDVDGNVQSVDSEDKLPKRTSSGTYYVRLFTKTPGTYKLSYDVVLANGNTVKKTLKVIAKVDGSAIKSVTFAGQNVYLSANEELTKRYAYENVKGGKYDTTKKSGKIKVTMNDGFKLKKIEVGTPHLKTETQNGNTKIVRDYDVNKTEGSHYTWKTVRNGKKIKLSSVDERTVNDGTSKYKHYTKFRETVGLVASTPIRITYFDKKNKTTKVTGITIDRLINK